MSNFSESYNNVAVDVENEEIKLPDGTILNSSLASDVCLAYERMCTANYLLNDRGVDTVSEAWEMADQVRRLMDDDGYTEEDAIEEVLDP